MEKPAEGTPVALPPRTISLWAFGFGTLTLISSFFVPLIPVGWEIAGFAPGKIFVLFLAAITLVLAAYAYTRDEDRKVYTVALGLALVGVALEYFVVALVAAAVIAAFFLLLGMLAG
jgi:hypothetical protein